MIETYAFLAMFTVQILVGSVLCPAMFIRRIRADSASFPDDRFAELFPGVSKEASTRRFITRYRNQNAGITALGLLLLGWLYIYTRRPGWDEGPVLLLICIYLFVQMAPQVLIARNAENYNKRLRASVMERKRRAVLERRGLFDFIPPLLLILAGVSYFLFAALIVYALRHPFPGFNGPGYMVVITVGHLFFGVCIFASIYGRKRNPQATHRDRLHAMGMLIKTLVYACIGLSVFMALNVTLGLLHLASWGLFEVSVFLAIAVIQPYGVSVFARRRPNSDVLSPGSPLPPSADNQSA